MTIPNNLISLRDWCTSLTDHPTILLLLSTLLLLLLAYLRHLSSSSSKLFVQWPIVGILPSIVANRHRLLHHATAILQESDGHTVLLRGPWFARMDFLLTCSPANANHLFSSNFPNYPKGPAFSEMFDVLGDGIFSADGDSWAAQRRMAQAHMAHPRFRSSVVRCTRDKLLRVLLPLLDRIAESNEAVDLKDIFLRFTFDTTSHLVLGADPGCLDPEFPVIPFAKALEDMEEVLLLRHVMPMAWWKSCRWLGIGKEGRMKEDTEVIDRFIANRIRERRENTNNNNNVNAREKDFHDLIGPYLARSDERPDDDDDKFLRDTLLAFLGAGKDTTGAGLVWFFWLLSKNPQAEKEILGELRGAKKSEEGGFGVLDAEEIDPLVYLHASLCEALRLYPPVPFNHKEAVKADVLPSGHVVSPGMRVIFSAFAMGRMEGIWGRDCGEFRPERWITEKGEVRQEASYKFIAFHSGPRSCLGKGMAFAQMKMVAAAVIYNYEVEVVEGHVPEPKASIVLQANNGLRVRMKKRERDGLIRNYIMRVL